MKDAEAQVKAFHQQGHRAELLDQAALRRLKPALCCDDWQGAVALEQGHLDLVRCARTWVECSDPDRLQVLTGIEVQALLSDGTRMQTTTGTLEADLVILAPGIWARPSAAHRRARAAGVLLTGGVLIQRSGAAVA